VTSNQNKPSYLKEMLTHKYSLYGLMGAVAGGAALSVVAAPLAAVPLIGYAAAQGVASLFVPGSRWWRDKVDLVHRQQARVDSINRLVHEIGRRNMSMTSSLDWQTFARMQDRVETLRRASSGPNSKVTTNDTETLADTSVNFLSLWLLSLVLRERQEAFRSEGVDQKIRDLDRRLSDDALQRADRQRFEKAKKDLEGLAERRVNVESQHAATRTGMLTLADGVEEVFHNIMKNPQSDQVRVFLDDAIARVRMDETVEAELSSELSLEDAFKELEEASSKERA
jgi:hypothetical protein